MIEPGYRTLSFEDRQKLWRGVRRIFIQHHGRNDRPTQWEIQVVSGRVFTTHGLVDGQKQSTDFQGKCKNKGKVNEISPEQDALAEARRMVRDKYNKEGYDEYYNGENIDHRDYGDVQAILTNPPGSLSIYKPENNLFDQAKLLKKAMEGKATYSLKLDGLAYFIVVDYYKSIQMYSRRFIPWNDKEGPTELADGTLDYSTVKLWSVRFPHIIEAVRKIGLPPGSMMAGELVWFHPGTSKESFAGVSSLTKSLTPQSLADQEAKGKPLFYWWDLPFLDGHDLVTTEKISSRYARIHGLMQLCGPSQYIMPVQTMQFDNPEAALAYAKDAKIEGWVVTDPDGIYGDKGWNLSGKPQRPACCAKLKPKQEDDFVCLWNPNDGIGEWGTGKHEAGKLVTLPNGAMVTHGGVGAVMLHQYNSKGELVPICKCSSGMDYETQACMGPNSFPFVAQIEYAERTYMSEGDKTNSLRFPVFIRRRDDKKIEECVNGRL